MQLVRVGLPPLTHAVIHVYRPQWMSSVLEFIDELSDVITSLGAECCNIFVFGDLNCPGFKSEHLDAGLECTLDALDLTQFKHEPTSGDSLLDVMASATSVLVSDVNVNDANCISDHSMVTANITTHCPKPTVTCSWRKFGKVDVTQFETALRQSELFSSPASTTDGFPKQLERVITSQLDKVAPIRYSSCRPPKSISRWLSTEAVAAKRERRRFEHRWQSTRDEHDLITVTRAGRPTNSSTHRVVNTSESSFLNETLSPTTSDGV